MNGFMRAALVIAASFGVAGTTALAAEGKTEATVAAPAGVGGTLTVNGKATKVAFAYARSVPGFFDKTKTDVEVILSDVALDAKALGDSFARSKLAKDGKIHTFEIIINSEGVPISTTWRHDGFTGPTPSGLSSADVFTKKVFDGKTVDGNYKSAATEEFFGSTYAFDVTFKAAIAH